MRTIHQAVSSAIPLTVLATFVVFLPVFRNGFVSMDDRYFLMETSRYRGFGWEQMKWMFSNFYMGHFAPLTWFSFSLDYALWDMKPVGYHLTNLCLHVSSAAVFCLLCLRLLGRALPKPAGRDATGLHMAAVFAALLFSIHPLRVEVVAWVSERKGALAGVFYLASLLFYLKAVEADGIPARRRNRLASMAAYVLSLLSKPIGMSLPLCLILLDLYPLGRLPGDPRRWLGKDLRDVWVEKVPYVIASGAAAGTALFFVLTRTTTHLEPYGLAERVAIPLFGSAFYLLKTVLPIGLVPVYQGPLPFEPFGWPVLLGAAVVAALSVSLVLLRRRWPAGLAAWVFYLIALSPVLGIVPRGSPIVADRYTYLPCLGWALLGGAGFLLLWERRGSVAGKTGIALLSALLAVLGSLTWRQVKLWRDSETLRRHTLAVYPDTSVAHNSLGKVLGERGDSAGAIRHFAEALRIHPRHPEAHNNLGVALAIKGRREKAIASFRRAIEIRPLYSKAHYNLGRALQAEGRRDEAIGHFRAALRADPDFAPAGKRLRMMMRRGRSASSPGAPG